MMSMMREPSIRSWSASKASPTIHEARGPREERSVHPFKPELMDSFRLFRYDMGLPSLTTTTRCTATFTVRDPPRNWSCPKLLTPPDHVEIPAGQPGHDPKMSVSSVPNDYLSVMTSSEHGSVKADRSPLLQTDLL